MAKYSDQQRAAALAALDANGGDARKTAKQTGIPYTTLREWVAGRVHEAVTELRNEKKQSLAARLEDLAHTVLDLLPDKLEQASAKDAAVTLGIAVEKAQLLKGEPTAIHRNEEVITEDERRRRLAELLYRGRDSEGASQPHAGTAEGSRPAPLH
jgi:transposase-like protein